ncbi:hypothetical protein KAFR_0F01370 [Kazachstania africana CBS 2517]|uniref:RAVE complex protein Rav1 C-terminal domain-containing protein n=1 Tax=Kazachstania africana (strain ATCC 22294 / BCRC 22015 / CBS 2517 / CECT 1963 / NBRC 1671 / NRRL Y-8276) TaxID=1071382 RepID=H2AWI3_KAZAF|nr:hypothetical protein KAFR_0F01370 [Kazachstania africana CBS 2517]CCF58733.1 hypothetical protein KAFR_0F01370 [Kazachstania africana CBS 2517]
MSLNFLPGRPNCKQQSVCQALWQGHTLFAYCSGNNLIIFSNQFTRLQTIYLDKDCNAVDINSENGFIALSYASQVEIYKPIHQIMKNPKWAFCCSVFHDNSEVNCLKWGSNNELVIGSDFLSFWKINDNFGEYEPVLLWNKKQSKSVYNVAISQDSQLITSYSKFDRTVKLWRRISLSGDQDIFNLILLPHPDHVTMVRWRKTASKQSVQLLYTLCSDKTLRIWSYLNIETDKPTLQQWGTLKLDVTQKYCAILDNWILEKVLFNDKTQFRELLPTKPELVLLGTNEGKIEIIALENLSINPLQPISYRKLLSVALPHPTFVHRPTYIHFAEIQPYDDHGAKVSLIVHDLEGVIRHSVMDLSLLLKEPLQNMRTSEFAILQHKFTGHNKSIQKLIRSSDGEAVLTLSRFSENCVWIPQDLPKGGTSLVLKNIIRTEAPIKLAVVHEKGGLVICLLENHKIQAWECPDDHRTNKKKSFLKSEYQLEAFEVEPLLILNTPETRHSHERHFIAIIFSNGFIKGFEVSSSKGICEVGSDSFNIADIFNISTIDPVHTSYISNRALVSVVTKKGVVTTYKAMVDLERRYITWIKSSELVTGMTSPTFVRGSSTNKLCTVDSSGKKMCFWDLNRGVLEYQETFDNAIEDIDWTSTELGQSIVSIGFTGYALLYTQVRYDYTNSIPSYLPVEKIDITSNTSHNIGDSIWLKNGIFVVASGNQLYIKDKSLDMSDPFTSASVGSRKILSNDVLHLNSVLNGPLPVYHPQFVIQAIYLKKLKLTKEIFLRLFLELRKLDLQSKDVTKWLPSNLNLESKKFFIERDRDYPVEIFPDPYPEFNRTVATALSKALTTIALPYLTRHQQITLITVIEFLEGILKDEQSVDYNGIRFLLGVKLFQSHRKVQQHLLMRDVSWALHSDNKEVLLSNLNNHITSWKRAQQYKIAFWATEEDLRRKFEEIARFEFTKNETKDPSRCSIFYLALKKKQVLLNLWKMSIGHPEQQKLVKFLSNDFNETRWKTAALKNAFALMSKHRYLDAATFFLLADSLKDSVNVLYKQVGDLDLAIGTCRIFEGDNGPVLGELLRTGLLPNAILQNDRWTCSFIYWKLKKKEVAIKALVTPPIDLENNKQLVSKEELVNKSFLVEDPGLLYLYATLRKRNVKYFIGSIELGNKSEYGLILRVAEILRRMGCNYLAVSLVKNWKFIEAESAVRRIKQEANIPGVNNLNVELTSSARIRPSLFDMFDNRKIMSKLDNVTSNSSPVTPNILENFLPSSSISNVSIDNSRSGQPKSLLADFMGQDVDRNSKKPTSLLDDFMTPKNEQKKQESPRNRLDNFTKPKTNIKKKSVATNAAPRNLLDDFM